MSLTREIKDFALDLGYSDVGVTTAEPFASYAEELKANRDAFAFFTESPLRPIEGADPRTIMPEAKSIIVTAFDSSKEAFPPELVGKIGRIYQARCYNAPRNRINGARRQMFKDYLEKLGMKVMGGPQLNVSERLAAARAGIATIGRNNFAYTRNAGSLAVLTAFVVDAELEYDEPTMEIHCPDGCRLCVDACPTGALEPLKLNPRKCIAYNCLMAQDDYAPSTSSHIPPEIREKMGSWIHGCDICQEVCPLNQKRLKANLPDNEFVLRIAEQFDLRKVLLLTNEYYDSVLKPMMYYYLRRTEYFQRNAAIALGNSGDRSHVPYLTQALDDTNPMVRGYSAWALGRLGSDEARAAIVKALKVETDESARGEMEAALAA